MAQVQQGIVASAPELKGAVVAARDLHLTLAVLALKDAAAVAEAQAVLHACADEILSCVQGRSMALTLAGLDCFRSEILFAKVRSVCACRAWHLLSGAVCVSSQWTTTFVRVYAVCVCGCVWLCVCQVVADEGLSVLRDIVGVVQHAYLQAGLLADMRAVDAARRKILGGNGNASDVIAAIGCEWTPHATVMKLSKMKAKRPKRGPGIAAHLFADHVDKTFGTVLVPVSCARRVGLVMCIRFWWCASPGRR